MTLTNLGVVVSIVTVLVIWPCAPSFGEGPTYQQRAQKLARLRADTERLEGELQAQRERSRNELRALASQEEELGLLIGREDLRLQTLHTMLNSRVTKQQELAQQVQDYLPPLKEAVDALKMAVRKGLPFKLEERLGELEELDDWLRTGQVRPETAASRLWQFVEDELKLTGENGLYNQVIRLEGHRELVEVVRLGMVAIYFRTTDGRVGMAIRQADGAERADNRAHDSEPSNLHYNGDGEGKYQWRVIAGREAAQGIESLFEAMRRQIRQGHHTLPFPLPRRVQ